MMKESKVTAVHEMRGKASNWSLENDADMLEYLKNYSQNVVSDIHKIQQQLNSVLHEAEATSQQVNNTFIEFIVLANTQFVENRVYDEDVVGNEEQSQPPEKGKPAMEAENDGDVENNLIPKISQALKLGLKVLDKNFEKIDITDEQDESEENAGVNHELIFEAKDPYLNRPLPYLIGSQAFQQDDDVGLLDYISEEEEKLSEPDTSSDSDSQHSVQFQQNQEDEDLQSYKSISTQGSDLFDIHNSNEKDVDVLHKEPSSDSSSDLDEKLHQPVHKTTQEAPFAAGDGDEDDLFAGKSFKAGLDSLLQRGNAPPLFSSKESKTNVTKQQDKDDWEDQISGFSDAENLRSGRTDKALTKDKSFLSFDDDGDDEDDDGGLFAPEEKFSDSAFKPKTTKEDIGNNLPTDQFAFGANSEEDLFHIPSVNIKEDILKKEPQKDKNPSVLFDDGDEAIFDEPVIVQQKERNPVPQKHVESDKTKEKKGGLSLFDDDEDDQDIFHITEKKVSTQRKESSETKPINNEPDLFNNSDNDLFDEPVIGAGKKRETLSDLKGKSEQLSLFEDSDDEFFGTPIAARVNNNKAVKVENASKNNSLFTESLNSAPLNKNAAQAEKKKPPESAASQTQVPSAAKKLAGLGLPSHSKQMLGLWKESIAELKLQQSNDSEFTANNEPTALQKPQLPAEEEEKKPLRPHQVDGSHASKLHSDFDSKDSTNIKEKSTTTHILPSLTKARPKILMNRRKPSRQMKPTTVSISENHPQASDSLYVQQNQVIPENNYVSSDLKFGVDSKSPTTNVSHKHSTSNLKNKSDVKKVKQESESANQVSGSETVNANVKVQSWLDNHNILEDRAKASSSNKDTLQQSQDKQKNTQKNKKEKPFEDIFNNSSSDSEDLFSEYKKIQRKKSNLSNESVVKKDVRVSSNTIPHKHEQAKAANHPLSNNDSVDLFLEQDNSYQKPLGNVEAEDENDIFKDITVIKKGDNKEQNVEDIFEEKNIKKAKASHKKKSVVLDEDIFKDDLDIFSDFTAKSSTVTVGKYSKENKASQKKKTFNKTKSSKNEPFDDTPDIFSD